MNWCDSVGKFAWQSACSAPRTWPFPYACSLLCSPSCVLRYLRSLWAAATQYRVLVTCRVSEFINTGPAELLATGAQTPTSSQYPFPPICTSLPLQFFRHMSVNHYIALKLHEKCSVSSSFVFIKSQSPGLISPQPLSISVNKAFLNQSLNPPSTFTDTRTPPTVVRTSSA